MATARKKATAVAKAPESTLPAHLQNMGTGRGNDNVTGADLIIPRLEVAQDLSPQIKKNKDEYIEGLEAGMLFNNVSSEIYGSTVRVIPVFFRREFLLFKDRKKGGGFRGAFDTMDEAKTAHSQLDDADDVEIIDAAVHFCLIGPEDGEALEQIAISMTKSKHKVSRQWNTMIRMAGEGDRFARGYLLSGVSDQNAAGEEFYNLKVAVHRDNYWASEQEYALAEEFYETMKSSKVSMSMADHGETTSSDDDEI